MVFVSENYSSNINFDHKTSSRKVTDKNIKLHIVTDIKVTINSLSLFGFRYLVGGRVIFTTKEKETVVKMRCVPF